MKKVYVLVNEWTIDGGYNENSGIKISVFDTLSYAQRKMIADASCWYDDNEREVDEWEHIESDMSIEYYEERVEGRDYMSIECYIEGEYIDNHICWHIEEKEIEFDPENK